MQQADQPKNKDYPFLKGGGEMGELMRTTDWSATALGTPDTWPQSLRTTLSIILNSKFPMFLWWGPELICFYNDAYRPSLGQHGKHPSILGMPAHLAWSEIWNTIKPLISQVLAGGESTWSEDQLIPIYRNGKIEDVYWTFSYSPVADESGEVAGVFVTCTETTAKIVANKQLEETNRHLKAAREADRLIQKKLQENDNNLRLIILQAPVAIAIFRGPEYVVEIANARALELWGRRLPQVLNKPILQAMPELLDQGIKQLLDNVFNTGEVFSVKELPIQLFRNRKMTTAYIDFVYDPLYDAEGNINGIITIGTEVTTQVLTRKRIEESATEFQAINEELVGANEELASTNEELTETQWHLQQLVVEIEKSESRFRNLVQQAPVAICLLRGRELVFEAANDKIQFMLGKDAAIIGKPFEEAVPELKGQPFFKLLDDVFTTGENYYGNETPAVINHKGQLINGYFTFIYQPIKNRDGITTAVMIVAIEVTEQVNARKKVEQAEEMLRFALEAANIGTWYINSDTRELKTTPRLRELFGYDVNKEMTFDEAIGQVTEDFRDKILEQINAAIENGGNYDFTYTMRRFNDDQLIWLRSLGKLSRDHENEFTTFSGVVMDITEQKQDEQRKSDFIGMVSHELKTPLTSLTAIVQVLNMKLKNSEDSFIAGALDKANIQVKKMGTMINGFLNISRLESGKIHVAKEHFDMVLLLTEMMDEVKLTVSSHNISLAPHEHVEVYADRDKIGSVISNLLTNAVKYSPKGKHIEVKCVVTGNNIQVSVKDEGMGIKPQDIDKLFDRYYRVETAHTRHISGFGIGLYLSSEIIHRHDGEIWVESESGKGSTFYFTLPL
ncbi:PAS domain S-box-containing protein [Mucilaginibacter mallensis]|uniref:histidine kinase n=1 Tax=Mucilaginibacter mallensis TaxID=652787 RepID=A0A1H2BP08_MUCMA|nr:ATP-binding protein [Mucilaginibacter mallensis]SDT59928.1 PAS domain S-box-containing protein [Mucilaginibacter mallensis]